MTMGPDRVRICFRFRLKFPKIKRVLLRGNGGNKSDYKKRDKYSAYYELMELKYNKEQNCELIYSQMVKD